jgi:DNA polymerase-3 subunit alpha
MKFLIFDTETTDLIRNSLLEDKYQPRVVEFFGHVATDDGEIEREVEFLCNPGIPIPKRSQEITGITNEMVQGKGPFHEHIEELVGLFRSADAVVAHNLAYDWAVVNGEFARAGMEGAVPWPMIRICTVQETEWLKGHRLTLSDLHAHLFDAPFKGAHRAREDVGALTRCFLELRARDIV